MEQDKAPVSLTVRKHAQSLWANGRMIFQLGKDLPLTVMEILSILEHGRKENDMELAPSLRQTVM